MILTWRHTLAAGEGVSIPGMADSVRVLSATGDILLRSDGGQLHAEGERGLRFKSPGEPWHELHVTDLSGAPNAVVLCLTLGGSVDDDRNVIVGTVTTEEQGETGYTEPADLEIGVSGGAGQRTAIHAATATARWVDVECLSTSAGSIRVGSIAVDVDQGALLNPGDIKRFSGLAALYAWNISDVAGVWVARQVGTA